MRTATNLVLSMVLVTMAFALSMCGGLANATTIRTAQQQPASWVEPTKAEPAGTKYRTFQSKTIKGEVSYLVYLPPDYETNKEKRYPVVYWLHGLGGDQRAGAGFVERLDAAIKASRAPAMIAVLVNGMWASMYCDSKDGQLPVESVIVKDLIPHVDATYRTIAQREARAVEGFSMGGFGAAHLGFKYPETFGVVSILAGALHNPDSIAERRAEIFKNVFGSDKDYFKANSPWTLLEKNADAIRGKTQVRIWVGDQDMLHDWNKQYHELMERLKIAHEFEVVPGVGHNYRQLYEKIGDKDFTFYAKAFASVK